MLDEEYFGIYVDYDRADTNHYVFGKIGRHNVAVTNMSAGTTGNVEASHTATHMIRSFPNIRNGLVLMVGICGGVWSQKKEQDVRLGDVVVGEPRDLRGGVLAYNHGKAESDGEFTLTRYLASPPRSVLTVLNDLKRKAIRDPSFLSAHMSNMFQKNEHMFESYGRPSPEEDRLFQFWEKHKRPGESCTHCDPEHLVKRETRPDPSITKVFYGTIGSADMVIKNANTRDQIAKRYKLLAFEMEAAGIIGVCSALVIRGVCDYADSHKNDQWHNFAAVAAAAYAKALLLILHDPGDGTERRGPMMKVRGQHCLRTVYRNSAAAMEV